jgi:hypothetical protein
MSDQLKSNKGAAPFPVTENFADAAGTGTLDTAALVCKPSG